MLGHPLLGLRARGHERLDDRDAHRVDRVGGGVEPLERLLERGRDRDVGRLGRALRDRLGHGAELRVDPLRSATAMFRSTAPLNASVSADIRSSIVSRRRRPARPALRSISSRSACESERVSCASPMMRVSTRRSIAIWCSWLVRPWIPTRSASIWTCSAVSRVSSAIVRAHLVGQRLVVRGERGRVLLDPLRQPAHGLGAALHVALHRLDDAGGLARDQIAVLDDPLLDRAGEVLVALVEVRERRGDVGSTCSSWVRISSTPCSVGEFAISWTEFAESSIASRTRPAVLGQLARASPPAGPSEARAPGTARRSRRSGFGSPGRGR